MTEILTRKSDETLEEYKNRLLRNKSFYDITWDEIAVCLNQELGTDYSPDKYRKESYRLERAEISEEVDEKLLELRKAKVKLSDERTQINAIARKLAREEVFKELALDTVKEMSKNKILELPAEITIKNTEKQGILCIGDWHYGLDVKEFFNKLKGINIEKTHYTIFLIEKKQKEIMTVDDDDVEGNDNDEEEKKDDETIDTKEENTEEQKIEKTQSNVSDTPEQAEEEKPIDINLAYPQKMNNINLSKVSISKIDKVKYDFYYLLNLYYNFTYESMKELKQSFMNYDILKRYIASMESSVTISFSDFDKTIMTKINTKGQTNSTDAKNTKKKVKKDIINCLTLMSKLTRMTRHMNGIFLQYMIKVIYNIIKENKLIREKIGDEKHLIEGTDYFMKIGHFMVNFKAYRGEQNTYGTFKESEFFKKVEKEDHYLEVQQTIQEQIIIDK